MLPPVNPFNSNPATPLRLDLFSSQAHPPASSSRKVSRVPSPFTRILGHNNSPQKRTPSRAPVIDNSTPSHLLDEPINQNLEEPTPLPHNIIGRDPELRAILSEHLDSLERVIDRYSRFKQDAAHQFNAELASYDHERTQARCELAVIQKQLGQSVESTERLKAELGSAKQRLRTLVDARRTTELKLGELQEVLREFESRRDRLKTLNEERKREVGEVREMAKQESRFLEEISGLKIVVVDVDRLRFEFKMIDMNHYDRPFILDLDLSSLDYQILALNPSLPQASSLLKQLNQTRDFHQFVCSIRQAFNQLVKAR